MLTYSNDPQLKADFVAEVKRHADADQIIKGTYGVGAGADWRGCAVGCAIHSYNQIRGTNFSVSDHAALAASGLWAEWLAYLEDYIFESLPRDVAGQWPLRLAEAIPVGADIEPVKWRFCAFLMQENLVNVTGLDLPLELKEQVTAAILGVLQLHETAIAAGEWDESATASAASATRSAASAVYEKYADKLIALLESEAA